MTKSQRPSSAPVFDLCVADLGAAGETMSDDELAAASGAMQPSWIVSWLCGSPARPDEWMKP